MTRLPARQTHGSAPSDNGNQGRLRSERSLPSDDGPRQKKIPIFQSIHLKIFQAFFTFGTIKQKTIEL